MFLRKGKYLPIYMTFHQFYCDFFNWQNFVSSDRGVTGRDGARRGTTGRDEARQDATGRDGVRQGATGRDRVQQSVEK